MTEMVSQFCISAVSTVSFVNMRENWLRSASVLRPLASQPQGL